MMTNNSTTYDKHPVNLILFAITVQVLADALILLNVPVARQFVSFIYLIFVPGLLLLRILGVRTGSMIESLLFSIGFSIATTMFVGFLANILLPLSGTLEPLSAGQVLLVMNIFTLALSMFALVFTKQKQGNF